MSHGTHEDHLHPENKPQTSFRSAGWLIVIIVGLFIAALNFVNVMSKSEGEEGKETAKTEAAAPAMANEKPAMAKPTVDSAVGLKDTTKH